MMQLLGVGILVTVIGLFLFFRYLDTNGPGLVVGIALTFGPMTLGVVGFALFLILGGSASNPLVENACYRAVRHTTTTLMPVGKVLIPSTTTGIDLEEIRCP